jgi:hypothetical protein
VLLDGSSSMGLKVEGYEAPQEATNQEGQRRLIASREFLQEKVKAPEQLQVEVSGLPTRPAGRGIAVGIAIVFALGGVLDSLLRRRSKRSAVAELSKEDRERASSLLLEELIALEQAFQHGNIGRKAHEHAKRQLIDAFARLHAA